MLIKTTTEIKKYIRVTENAEFETSFQPFVEETEQKYLLKYLSQDQYDELQVYYDAELDSVETLNKLLEHAQRVITKFLLKAASAFIDIEMSEGGFTVNNTNTASPASSQRVERLIETTYAQGWDALEIMLKYLEDNVDSFPLWAASDAYTLQRSTLIQNASEFDEYFTIKESRLWFFRNKSLMRDVENEEIKSKISEDLYNTLLSEINDGSISAASLAILPNIKRAITNFTAARSMNFNKHDKKDKDPTLEMQEIIYSDSNKLERMASFYLNKALNTILNNLTDYPDYTNSDLYDADFEAFENDIDNNIFVAGGTL